jgi:transposase
LTARGETVTDVPSTATARVRELSRGGRRKNDVIDAAAAASVAALHGDATPVLAEDTATVLGLLDERRNNLITQRTRLVNQLHSLLRDLLPGGADTSLTAAAAFRLLAGIRPVGPGEAARKQLARDLVAEIRDVDHRIKAVTKQIAAVVAETGSRLTEVSGVGPVIAGRLLGRTRRASRFPSAAAFANYAVSPRSRWPRPVMRDTGSQGAATASSTSHRTSWPSPRSRCATAPDAATTTRKRLRARPTTRRCAASNADSQTISGER